MVTKTKIFIANILSTISLIISSIFILTALCGCKFAIKEYTSSIGELTAETIKGTNP